MAKLPKTNSKVTVTPKAQPAPLKQPIPSPARLLIIRKGMDEWLKSQREKAA